MTGGIIYGSTGTDESQKNIVTNDGAAWVPVLPTTE
jgi:hypothetical protein